MNKFAKSRRPEAFTSNRIDRRQVPKIQKKDPKSIVKKKKKKKK